MSEADFIINNNILKEYRGNERIISIPDGVTQIAPYAFCKNTTLNSVSFPASTWRICSAAFSGCNNLEKVILPDNIRTIEDWAFENCFSLKEVSVPSSLEHIGKKAFSGCSYIRINRIVNDNKTHSVKSDDTASSNTVILDEPGIIKLMNTVLNKFQSEPGSRDNAFKTLKQLADNNNRYAQFALGQIYDNGYSGDNITININPSLAISWYTRSADQDYVEAQYILGKKYESGEGCTPNIDNAVKWYKKAASQNNNNAIMALDRIQQKKDAVYRLRFPKRDVNKNTTPNDLENRIQKGDTNAMFELAHNYYIGKNNYKEDYNKAAYWYYQAAVKGHVDAQYELGRLYESGSGVGKVNLLQALNWYEKSAHMGNKNAITAENRIKVLLNRREKIDFHSIDMLFRTFDEAAMNRYLKEVLESHFNISTKKPILTIKYHAYNGNPYAQYALGALYEHKKITPNPLYEMYGEERADYWYTRSAELGYKRAGEKLQEINGSTQSGQTKKEPSSTEINSLLGSANSGNRVSQYQLARNYSNGKNGFKEDEQKATEWFLKSAIQDYMDAQYEMGRRYESGTGVQKSFSEAYAWYSKAAAQGHAGAKIGAKRVKAKI